MPPPGPPASLSLFRPLCRGVTRLVARGILSQNQPEKFHWICEPRQDQFGRGEDCAGARRPVQLSVACIISCEKAAVSSVTRVT